LNDQGLKDAIVYAKRDNNFMSFGVSPSGGNYAIHSLNQGIYEIIVNRMGYYGASRSVVIGLNNMDTINFRLRRVVIGDEQNGGLIPSGYRLYQNYPNPFNPMTNINFDVPVIAYVSLIMYDLLGREVVRLVDNEYKKAGTYNVQLDASGFSSGVYFCRFQARQVGLRPPGGSASIDFSETKKMVVIK
jgi:hypothetical protein